MGRCVPTVAPTLAGKYCAACGQKKVDRRYFSIRRFFGHVLSELTDLQSNKILGHSARYYSGRGN